MEKFNQVCVWPATILEENQHEDLVKFFKDKMGTRVSGIETVVTNPDTDKFGNPVEDTGGRHDVFFKVHDDDVMKFAIPRLKLGIRWWEDVIGNENHTIYPESIQKKYPKTW